MKHLAIVYFYSEAGDMLHNGSAFLEFDDAPSSSDIMHGWYKRATIGEFFKAKEVRVSTILDLLPEDQNDIVALRRDQVVSWDSPFYVCRLPMEDEFMAKLAILLETQIQVFTWQRWDEEEPKLYKRY